MVTSPLPTEPTLNDWRALARSGPWRWDRVTVVLTDRSTGRPGEHRLGSGEPVRLRLTRGAATAHVESLDGTVLQEGDDPGDGPGGTPETDRWANREDGRAEKDSPAMGWGSPAMQADRARARRDKARLYELNHPARRRDGLVSTRALLTVPDPPYWHDYFVTALLDPVELADGAEPDQRHLSPTTRPSGVELLGPVRVHEREGRLTWTAELLPTEAYEPRCGCCALVTTYAVASNEFGDKAADLGWSSSETGPERAVVSLDVETAIVTELRVQGGPEGGQHVTLDIEEVVQPA